MCVHENQYPAKHNSQCVVINAKKQLFFFSDTHAWFLSKYDEGRSYSNDISTLAVAEKSFRTFAILCEHGKYIYVKCGHLCYQILLEIC